MAEKTTEAVPTWMYRRTASGKVSSQLFQSDKIPPGWVDSPAKCVKKAAAERKESKDGGS